MKRIFLHVGTPKTGTSYLQQVLFENRRLLESQGILYPADRFDGQFLAALDLMSLPWGGLEAEAVGSWDRLAQQTRTWLAASERHHTAIISHEIFARATPSQAERALVSLGRDGTRELPDGVEIHLVLSARDLVRQIPAEWQENVKHRASLTYRKFIDQLTDPTRKGRIGSWFWSVQELPDILDRWGSSLPPDHIHLVTVPRPGPQGEDLWQRFVRVFDLSQVELELGVERTNPSMGVPETALIRLLNQRALPAIKPEDYRPMVRELLAHQTLSQRRQSPRLSVPPDLFRWAEDLSLVWIDEITRSGYDVVGDLDDLRPQPAPASGVSSWHDPDQPDYAQVSEAAIDAIKALVLENGRLNRDNAELTERAAQAEQLLIKAERGWKGVVLDRARSNAAGRVAHRAYRAVLRRGNNSRSA